MSRFAPTLRIAWAPPIVAWRLWCLSDRPTDMVISAATGEPAGILRRAGPGYAPDAKEPARINATLLALVRNEELPGMLQAMKDLERTWNHKFNYPWTFFNDKPFTDEFKKRTSEVTNAETRYGKQRPS